MKNNKGFTLIEIIAVLVIIGILAASAVPKYFDIQSVAEQKSLQIALVDMKSRALVAHEKSMLNNNGSAAVADQHNFSDLGLDDLTAVTDAYKDFAGTWAERTGTVIAYTGANFGYATFNLTAGSATSPASIELNIIP